MTAVFAEDFTGGAIGATVSEANTGFTNVSGLGSSTFIADPFDTGRMMQVATVANGRFHERDITPTDLMWATVDIDPGSPPDVNVPIMQGFATATALAAEKVFDLRITAGTRNLQLRNATSVPVWTSTALAASTKHRVWVMSRQGATASARRLRVVIFSGGTYTTLSQDSGELTSNTTQATIGHLRFGVLIDATTDIRFGRVRIDNSTGPTTETPATVALGPDITGVEPGDTVTLTANTTGGSGSVVFTQTAGPTVALTGTGNSRSFVAPAYWPSGTAPSAPTLTFQATYGAASDTISVTPYVHTRWRKSGVSSWMPVFLQRKTS